MTNEELTAKYKALAETGPLAGLFTVLKVDNCNYKVDGLPGHPFCIGTQHVEHASNFHGGMLGKSTLNAIPCKMSTGMGLCNRPYSAHTSDKALFIKLIRNLENKEAAAALFSIKEDMIADGIDGVALVDTPERFRILPKESPCDPAPAAGTTT